MLIITKHSPGFSSGFLRLVTEPTPFFVRFPGGSHRPRASETALGQRSGRQIGESTVFQPLFLGNKKPAEWKNVIRRCSNVGKTPGKIPWKKRGGEFCLQVQPL